VSSKYEIHMPSVFWAGMTGYASSSSIWRRAEVAEMALVQAAVGLSARDPRGPGHERMFNEQVQHLWQDTLPEHHAALDQWRKPPPPISTQRK
jgi:hypothetical protein